MSDPLVSTEPSLLDLASAEDLAKALKRRCDFLILAFALPKNGEETLHNYRFHDKGDSFTLLGIARHLERRYETHLAECVESDD